MSEHQVESSAEGRPKRRRYTFGAIVIGVAIAVLELFVLEGEVVFRHQLDGEGPYTVTIPIDHVGERHLIEIATTPKASIECTLVGPDGTVLVEIDEMKRHRRHYAELTPEQAGAYQLTLSGSRSTLLGRVEVLLGDHRVFGPWGYWLGL